MAASQHSPGRHYGKLLKSCQFSHITLTESRYEANSVLPVHFHDNPYFSFSLKGQFIDKLEGREFISGNNNLLFHSPHTEHTCRFLDETVHCFFIEFDKKWIEPMVGNALLISQSKEHKGMKLLKLVSGIYQAFLTRDFYAGLISEGLTLQLIAETSCQPAYSKKAPGLVKRILDRLKEEKNASEGLLLQLSHETGYSASYISRVFKKETGYTIGEYLLQLRIDESKFLLRQHSLTITEIAQRSGFYDSSHFSKYFRRYTGLTPIQYRLSN